MDSYAHTYMPTYSGSRVPRQTLLPLWLPPLEPRGDLHSAVLQPALHRVPIDALVHGIRVRRWLLMVADPVVRHEASIELAHDTLPDVVYAVLIVALIHLGDFPHLARHVWERSAVVVLPDVVQAVDLVRAHRRDHVAAARLRWEPDSRAQRMVDALDVRG
jgi:hypothetical protein